VIFEKSQALNMHGIREQEDEDDEENDIEIQCNRILSLHCLDIYDYRSFWCIYNLGLFEGFGIMVGR
jgi:hypothetical protein